VDIDAERAPEDPKVFTRIPFPFRRDRNGTSATAVERAIHLSAEEYCSASIMLGKTAAITHDFEIRRIRVRRIDRGSPRLKSNTNARHYS
jgi:putative redox protein